jgi:hypothetical protein
VIVRGSTAVIVPLYKNLRIAKFLDFMVFKDSIVAHPYIKIHKLPKNLCALRYIRCLSFMFIRK